MEDPGTGLQKRLTSGGRMGSPQAAHLGANTLGEKQRSRQVHIVVFREGKAKCFWETCSWGLQGALLTGPALPSALQPSYKEAHSLGVASVLLQDCS